MAWFLENWFWVLIFIAFMAMHVFGHGGHGGHGKGEHRPSRDEGGKGDADGPAEKTSSGGHQH